MIYGVLYDSTLAWYKRQKVEPEYLDFYAITSLAAMQFGNCLTVSALLACLNVGSSREFFYGSGASKGNCIALAALLLALNYAYSKFRPRLRPPEPQASLGSRMYWIAAVYMVVSIVAGIYVSTLL